VLVTLLHLRDMAARAGKACPVVSEMHDVRNRDLAARRSQRAPASLTAFGSAFCAPTERRH
jgi:hypothetical protein